MGKKRVAKVAANDGASTSSTEGKRRRRGPPRNNPPRPANAWICYRSAKVSELKSSTSFANLPQAEVSKLIGQLWAEESPDVKAHYEREAAKRKKEHQEAYPDYAYRPVRREKSERPSRKKADKSVAAVAPLPHPFERFDKSASVVQHTSPPASIGHFPTPEVQHQTLPQTSLFSLPYHSGSALARFEVPPVSQQPLNTYTFSLLTPPAEYRSDPFLSAFLPDFPTTCDPTLASSRFKQTYLTPPLSATSSSFDTEHSEDYLEVPCSSIDPRLLAALDTSL